MSAIQGSNDDDLRVGARAAIQRYARAAGVLIVVSVLAGAFGEAYVPSRLLAPGDAATTAAHLRALDSLFRWGFVGYLCEALCDVALSLIFFVLLRPVRRDIALLATLFGLMSTTLFAGTELFYIAAPLTLGGGTYLKSFSPAQLETLAHLSLRLYGYGAGVFSVFYGVAWVLRGYLMFRSGYLPKPIGALLAVGGLAFVARSFAMVLAPALPSAGLVTVLAPGALLLAVWLLAKGVDVPKWEARAASSEIVALG